MSSSTISAATGEVSDKEESDNGVYSNSEYFGWVYHLGVNSIGREYCHLRFLLIRGKYVEMYKRDPSHNSGIKPIRKGIVVPTFTVEELGRQKVNKEDLYVLRFYNRLDETKKGEIACAAAGEAKKWMEAFDNAKHQAEFELSSGRLVREKLNMDNNEINLDGHRPRVRRYAHGLRKLIQIGHGPERLLRHSTDYGANVRSDSFFDGDAGDAIEAHEWRCVFTINGIRIFEDVAENEGGKSVLVKSVGVVDANADTVFEVLLNLEKHQRYEWDTLTGDLELIESYDGHYDVVYGTRDSKYFTRCQSKEDFVFSRQWFSGQDGTYTILQTPGIHKKKPLRPGFQRTKIIPSTWEIRNLDTYTAIAGRCLLTHMLEIQSMKKWCKWKETNYSKFEKSMPYVMLCQVAGLKEFIGANPALKFQSYTVVRSKVPHVSISTGEHEELEAQDEFYDAIAADSSSDDEESDNNEEATDHNVKLRNVSWAITSLALKRTSARDSQKELDPNAPPINIDVSLFSGSMLHGNDETSTNCWTSPSGEGFMIRGKTYLQDHSKVMGGDPLLRLIAVDWFKVEKCTDRIALHPSCLVQSEAGKKLPFILVINLEVPAKPNYSMVLYFAADRPLNKSSTLGKFVDGTDLYRDSRFKLIPSIVEGYWMVKRAVGTKACLLGKAVTCKYLRRDNFLEIDVDIGSSSVARGVIGLVLGYVTSLVVDLAILIEGKEEAELPEYILGTVRLNRIRPEAAVAIPV